MYHRVDSISIFSKSTYEEKKPLIDTNRYDVDDVILGYTVLGKTHTGFEQAIGLYDYVGSNLYSTSELEGVVKDVVEAQLTKPTVHARMRSLLKKDKDVVLVEVAKTYGLP